MPIPEFDAYGFLPVGVYDCTLEQLRKTFGTFHESDRRVILFEKLCKFIDEARRAGIVRSLLIDGSFVSSAPTPNDIDIVVVLPRSHDVQSDLPPLSYNIVSKRSVQKRFGFDTIAVREGTIEESEAVAFFQQVRGDRMLRKGIVRLRL